MNINEIIWRHRRVEAGRPQGSPLHVAVYQYSFIASVRLVNIDAPTNTMYTTFQTECRQEPHILFSCFLNSQFSSERAKLRVYIQSSASLSQNA